MKTLLLAAVLLFGGPACSKSPAPLRVNADPPPTLSPVRVSLSIKNTYDERRRARIDEWNKAIVAQKTVTPAEKQMLKRMFVLAYDQGAHDCAEELKTVLDNP